MKQKIYRQGDVLVRRIEKLPKGVTLKKVEDKIIAHGEFSGHAHFLTSASNEAVLLIDESSDKMYLDIPEHVLDAQLQHLLERTGVWTKEHTPIAIPAGTYECRIHQQYDPYLKAVTRVND